MRTPLPEGVHGRLAYDLITVRRGLSPAQELQALVHETAHWLVHRDARGIADRTLFEYEAEAVEILVLAHLGLPCPRLDLADFGCDSPTDGLLSASVTRVLWASEQISGALGLRPPTTPSEPEAAVDFEAAAGEEVVLEYETHGMSDFFGLPQAL
jgi:hypothetical protein